VRGRLFPSLQGLDLLPRCYKWRIAMTEDDRREIGVGSRVGTAYLGYGRVELIFGEKGHFVYGPPAADARARPLVAVEVECAEAPTRLAPAPIVGHHEGLVGESVALLWWSIARKLDSEGVIVLDNGCACFFCHIRSLVPRL
jgi:hypothetical protein